jgi:predicted metal-dependent peptidase
MPETTANELGSVEETEELRKIAESFKLSNHLVKMLLKEPFFATVLRDMAKVKTESIPTAGVTVREGELNLFWNPMFFAGLKGPHVTGVLKHECWHLILKHCTSRKQDMHFLWNIATDLAINSMLPLNEMPDCGLLPGRPLDLSHLQDPSSIEKWKKVSDLIESFPTKMASEWYMEKLKQDEEVSKILQEGSGEFSMDDHDGWGDMSDEDRQVAEGKLRKILKDAVRKSDRTGQWGTVSSDQREMLRQIVSNAIDWKKVLHNFCGRSQRADRYNTHRRINRKYPYIHPGSKRRRTATVAIYMDQSGSVSDEDVTMFFGALGMLGKLTNFILYPFDWTVDDENVVKWKRGRSHPPVRTSCGGTNFVAVENHVKKHMGEFDGHIILTDGGAADPGPSKQRRCWVLLPGCSLPFKPHRGDIVVTMDALHAHAA